MATKTTKSTRPLQGAAYLENKKTSVSTKPVVPTVPTPAKPTIGAYQQLKAGTINPDQFLKNVKTEANQKGEVVSQKMGVPKPTNSSYNAYEALQTQKPGNQPISPFVAGKVPTPPAKPSVDKTTPTGVIDTTSTMQQAKDELSPGFDKWSQDHGQLFDMASEHKDEKVASYEELYKREVANLEKLRGDQEKLTAQKNSVVEGSAGVQKQEVENAYNNNLAELRAAQERLDNAQRKTIAEREKQLERKKVNEENMLALIGGFGSMAGNKMLLDSVEEGEDKVAWLKTEFSLQDTDLSNKIVDLTKTYKTDKNKIEQWKQEQIQTNYENLQSYIEKIVKDENLADEDKVERINRAKDEYNDKVSGLSKEVIDARYELSQDIIKRSDDLRKEMEDKAKEQRKTDRDVIEDARADLELISSNYSLENYEALPQEAKDQIALLEEKAALPAGFIKQAINNLKNQSQAKDVQVLSQTNGNGDWTIVALDKTTGGIVGQQVLKGAGKGSSLSGGGIQGANGNTLSKSIFTSKRLLNEPIGSATINGINVTAKASVINKLNSANDAMKAAGLGGLKIRSSFRTNQEQQHINDTSPEATNAGMGESFHEAGQAVDVDNWKEAEPYLRAMGLVNDISWDKGHFSIGETNQVDVKVDEFDMPSAPTTEQQTTPSTTPSALDEDFGDFN